MNARPILFSSEMVRALLEGRKTQTRRIIKPQPTIDSMGNFCWDGACYGQAPNGEPRVQAIASPIPSSKHNRVLCPYGQSGDLLWVRETWRNPMGSRRIAYQADGRCGAMVGNDGGGWSFIYHGWLLGAAGRGERLGETYGEHLYGDRWRPSIHMPRWASRLTLEITGVRVEQLQDISEDDARAEGAEARVCGTNGPDLPPPRSFRTGFVGVWRAINGDKSWFEKPWVWVLEFRVHRQNVDAFLAANAA